MKEEGARGEGDGKGEKVRRGEGVKVLGHVKRS